MQEYISEILSLLGGGLLTSLIAIPYAKKKAKAEAEKASAESERSVLDNYEMYTKHIEERFDKEIAELKQEVAELKRDAESLKAENDRQHRAIMASYPCPYLVAGKNTCPVQETYKGGAQ